MIKYEITEILSEEKIPLSLVKSYLRVTDDENDDLLRIITSSAINMAENYTGKSIDIKKIKLKINGLKSRKLFLKYSPILDLESIYDQDSESEILPKDYKIDDEGMIFFEKNLIGKNIEIHYISGFKIIPATIKQGILIHISEMFDQQNCDIELNRLITRYYFPHKKMRL